MSNIAKAFENGKAFIPFITCGDPDLETTAKCIVEMQNAGASLVELGIPFSDPTAEGPVIMEASLRALENGCTTDKVFEMVKKLRNEMGVTIPMVFMTYANVVFSYGIGRFCQNAAECGVDGIILPEQRGTDGFGYDPVFLPDGYDQTFAEMDAATKNSISHRGRAIRQLAAFLMDCGN